MRSSLTATIGGRRERSQFVAAHRHADTPLVWRTMKATSSGVAFSAAKIEVPLVLPVLVVDHHHRLAGTDGLDGIWNGVEPHR